MVRLDRHAGGPARRRFFAAVLEPRRGELRNRGKLVRMALERRPFDRFLREPIQVVDQRLPRVNWRASANSLTRRGLLTSNSVLPPPGVKPKKVRTVQLATRPEVAEAELPNLGKEGSGAFTRRQAILRYLIRDPGPVDATWVYAESGGNSADLRYLAERELVSLGESEIWRDPLNQMDFQPSEPPPLTSHQQGVWNEIQTCQL